MAEERTGKLEEISIKTIQSEEQRKNNWGGKKSETGQASILSSIPTYL